MCDKVNSIPFDTFKMFLIGVTEGSASMRLLVDPMPMGNEGLPPIEEVNAIKLILANKHMVCYWRSSEAQEGYIATIEHIYEVKDEMLLTEVVATTDIPKDFVEKVYSLLKKGPYRASIEEEDDLPFVEV